MNRTLISSHSLDWGKILLSVGINVPIYSSEFNVLCPFHLDNHSSCSINIDKGVWICHAGCGQGSLKSFLKRKLNLTQQELDALCTETEYTLDLDFFEQYQPTDDALQEVTLPDEFILGKYPTWIFTRGFTRKTLDSWGCGTNRYQDLIIPIKDENNRLVGWVSRRRSATPKYLYSKGLQKSKVLFGAADISPTKFVCVTEGTLDTMWLRQHGHPAVAILGMHLSNRQKELLSKLRTQEVVLCLDNDEAGRIGLTKALEVIGNTLMVSYIDVPNGYKDVQEIKDSKLLDKAINKRYYW